MRLRMMDDHFDKAHVPIPCVQTVHTWTHYNIIDSFTPAYGTL